MTIKISSRNYNQYKQNIIPYKYSPIKNISGNRCACCNNEMIQSESTTHLWSKITLPIIKTFKGKYFCIMKECRPGLYKVIEYFAKSEPNKSFESIVSDDSNHSLLMAALVDSVFGKKHNKSFPTRVAYRKAIKQKTMEIFNAFEKNLQNSSKVIKEIKPYEKYLSGERKKIFEELEKLSLQYPDKKIHELVQMPKVIEKHSKNINKDAIAFIKNRDYHWKEADNIILKCNPNLKPNIDKLHKNINKIYDDGSPLRTSYLIQNLYRDFLVENNIEHLEKEVIEEVSKMPTRELTKDLYLLLAARKHYSDGDIIKYIIRPSVESEKRLINPNNGGDNQMKNKIIMCHDCCDKIGSVPFQEFYINNTQMTQNIKNQINLYERKILDGSIDFEFRNYPIEVAKTLKKFSNGLIEIDTTAYERSIKEIEDKENLL